MRYHTIRGIFSLMLVLCLCGVLAGTLIWVDFGGYNPYHPYELFIGK